MIDAHCATRNIFEIYMDSIVSSLILSHKLYSKIMRTKSKAKTDEEISRERKQPKNRFLQQMLYFTQATSEI